MAFVLLLTEATSEPFASGLCEAAVGFPVIWNRVVARGVQMNMGGLWTTRKRPRYLSVLVAIMQGWS